ncbi:hypothetical protein EMCRGX_G027553, partial [Ephydatia muelleri]
NFESLYYSLDFVRRGRGLEEFVILDTMDPVENFYDYDELEGPEEERYRRKHIPSTSPLRDKTGSTECLYNPATHSSEALSTLTDMRASRDLVDVTIQAGDLSFSVHRIALAACSPYFRAMFSGDNRESTEGVVVIKELDPAAVRDVIDFCYSGKIMINTTNVLNLLPAACLFQLAGVQDACCSFLTAQLHPSNCLGFRKFADVHHCASLWKKCNVFMQQRFPEVALHEEFLELTFEELSEVIGDDHLNVRGEEQVFEAAVAWVKHRLDERKVNLASLMGHIRMPLMSAAYLSRVVKSEPLVMESFQGRGFLIESMDYHLQKHYMKDTPRVLNVTPRCCPGLEYLFAIGGSGPPVCEEDPYLDLCECYNLDKNDWRLMAPMPMKRSGVRVVTAGGYIFVLGGFSASDTKALSAVDRYDPMSDSWRTVAPLNYPRRSFGVATLNGYIYAMGGINGGTYYDSVERYCSKSNRWTLVHPMTIERRAVCSTALDGYIYAAGLAIACRRGLHFSLSPFLLTLLSLLSIISSLLCSIASLTPPPSPFFSLPLYPHLPSFLSSFCPIIFSLPSFSLPPPPLLHSPSSPLPFLLFSLSLPSLLPLPLHPCPATSHLASQEVMMGMVF